MVTDDRSRVATPSNSGVSAGLRVRIDQGACTGDGLCVTRAPSVFEHDIDGLAYVKSTEGELLTQPGARVVIPLPLVDAVVDAADECPGDCIYVERPDGTLEAGPGS
ncbi:MULTISPECIES: ferredoxin [unclassified Pseudofrankia]|uniref:ferredoxin n=1 Tax=unclassified Pseudofrankia TaxID=2994372 RepID=UPI0008D9DCCC|nr:MULTISPECIES: ferredoxin [unclassified Pseudofrankia]MDT3441701.1 ferredoxin [Pseudofrankia sp. BMG5.37]OHV50355.1 ferredoxin [Pseudofrankia sp. BMG5.36]